MSMKAIVMNKRIVLALGMMVFVAALLISSTGAFFNDTETSTGNVFTAGAVDIAIQNITHNGPTEAGFALGTNGFNFSFLDLKPLDNGTVTYTLENNTNPAYICAMVNETGNTDNGVIEPETEAGDVTPGIGGGELGNFLSFNFGTQSGSLSAISGVWQDLGQLNTNATSASAIEYCFGEFDGGGNCVLNNTANYNLAQTDSLTADVSFYAVQTRHNDDFSCASLNNQTIGNDDLFTTNDRAAARLTDKWFFYNDTNDTIMTLNQFTTTGGANEIVTGPVSTDAAYMKLDSGTQSPDYDGSGDLGNPRYNIATYQFAGTPLASISSLKYRIYDASVSSQTPFMNFNVSFDGSNTWQKRLVQVPSSVPVNTWTTVDAIDSGNALWTYSGNFWPAGGTETGTTPGTTAKTWASILADYPSANVLSGDSWFGIRVGHPGPIGEEGYVDWVEFDGVQYDFGN